MGSTSPISAFERAVEAAGYAIILDRNLDAFLAHWDGKMTLDDLLAKLRKP